MAEKKGRQKVSEAKLNEVDKLVELMDSYPIVGMVNMQNLPAKQLTNMRAQLRGSVELIMTKKTFINLALDKSKKPGIDKLRQYMKGMPAMLFTKENPFSLFKLLKKNKSTAPIKAGQEAPNEIVVPAGATSFSPGPIIGEMGSFKIKAGIENGKVAIKQDAVVAKEGEEVSSKLAGLLTRLGIEPMEIGLDLVAVYENKEILTKDVLDIDEQAYIDNIKSAAAQAFNLAINVGIIMKDNVEFLLSKCHGEAYALAKEAGITTSETIKEQLAQAEAQASALKSRVPEKQEPAGEKPEEKEAEEEKQEPAEKAEEQKDKEKPEANQNNQQNKEGK